jgi:N,N-dimethylformamidase
MLIGHVSDEYYAALADVMIEFLNDRGESWETRSRASGSVYLDLPEDEYIVVLRAPGYCGKRTRLRLNSPHQPVAWRLLSDRLSGYVWPKWLRAGDTGEFRVHSATAYHLELWHYGWEPRLAQSLGWHDEHAPRATVQITPDGDYTQTGVAWNKIGYHSPTHRQSVVAPMHSGLYYFRARNLNGEAFSFPWIVAPAKPQHRLAVLASTLTWNAYNNFGGRSNYLHADGLPATPTVHARTEHQRYLHAEHQTWGGGPYPALSFDRPEPFNHIAFLERITDPVEGRQACHLAPAEWRLLGWLERQQIPFDYYAENQLDDGTLDVNAYRVLIIAVHPEYWTRRMYDRVKSWVFDRGGRLLYLGGNGLNCEVELTADGTAMICHNGALTSLWPSGMAGFDSRMAMRHESEAALLGVVFTPAGAMTAAPYAVVDEQHWVLAGTGLRNGQTFGHQSLHRRCPGGASGHETDKRSAHSPKNVQLIARGCNPDAGGAEMIYFDTPTGGAVFSVGSINYVLSLPVDETISRITANVIHRFLE